MQVGSDRSSGLLKPSSSEPEEDDNTPAPKRLKVSISSTSNYSQESKEAKETSTASERLKSLSDVPSDISFETEIPILEKSLTATVPSGGGLQTSSSGRQTPPKERESCSYEEKVDSLGVLFEMTVHNSNILHVCCQLSGDSGVPSKATSGKSTGKWKGVEELRG